MIIRSIRNSVKYSLILKKQPLDTSKLLPTPWTGLTSDLNLQLILRRNTSMESTSTHARDDETRVKAHRLCSEHLGGAWSKVDPLDLSILPISGGMSNVVYCCSLPDSVEIGDGEPSQVLLRFYGQSPARTSIQLEIFRLLSHQNLGPKLYGKFEDGRIEEFLHGTSLTCNELTNYDISMVIAKKLAAVHCLDAPMEKGNNWLKERYTEWTDDIRKLKNPPDFDEVTGQSTKDIAAELLSIDFNKEIDFLLDVFDKTHSPKVFSHNDLHQGNILLAKSSKRRPTLEERVVLIDFEYCSYNYRAYDIANHFSEWCFEYDTSDYPHYKYFDHKFPSREIQLDFVRNYINRRKRIMLQSRLSNIIEYDKSESSSENGSNGLLKEEHLHSLQGLTEEESFLEEVKPFLMGANFLWTLWCIKSAYNSTINFGYWEHAMTRWQLYSKFKSAFIKESSSQNNNNIM